MQAMLLQCEEKIIPTAVTLKACSEASWKFHRVGDAVLDDVVIIQFWR